MQYGCVRELMLSVNGIKMLIFFLEFEMTRQ